MNEREELPLEGPGHGDRQIVYCLIPPELADELHDPLRRHFRDDPGVEAIVERRRAERRSADERRAHEGAAPGGSERRLVRAVAGRRIAERRAELAPVSEPPLLPRRARRHADQIAFVKRLEPPTLRKEDIDTARLVARFQAGDQEAFSTLYSRYFERVYGYLRVVLANPHDAEDGAQQVFLQVLEGLPAYERRRQPFRAWLFIVARNYALYYLRQSGRLEIVDPNELDARREATEWSEEELDILGWITDRDLTLFVERLPLPQRQVLTLRYMLDLSHAQVAAVLGRTESDVRALQSRAISFLNERLTAIGRGPKSTERSSARTYLRQAPVLRARRFALKD